jgi:hypothetical protein
LEGLEVTVLKLSELVVDNDPFRLDSEFHRKASIASIKAVCAVGAEQFRESSPTIIHPHEIVREYVEEGGVWFLRAQNVRPLALDEADKVFVSQKDAKMLAKNCLEFGDILITRTGANRGDCAFFDSREEAVASSHTFIVRSARWRHAFLVAFLNCHYGRLQIEKVVYGAAQPEVAPYYLRNIWIPKLSPRFQDGVSGMFDTAARERNKALLLKAESEKVLLDALGLGNWQPPEPLTYTRRASEAFAAERLDAEFFQEQFVACRRRLLEAGALEFIAFDGLLETLTNGHTPLRHDLSVGEVPFLCAEHVTDFECHYDSEKRILLAHHKGELGRTAVRNGDVLLTIKGRIGNFAIAENVLGPVNINQDVALARLNCRLPKWWVVTFFNSRLGKLLVQQFSTGGINPFLGLSNVRKLPIPRFQDGLMNEVAEATRARVHAARAARARARELLERAKRAVEIAIEQGEKAALELIA